MQAAVVSVLLMAGVCGAPPNSYDGSNYHAAVQQNFDDATASCTIYKGTARDRTTRSGTLWSPITPNGTVTYDADWIGRPRYSPLWLVHGRATFYPGNYAKPYDYREVFNYPWNGPRPLAPMTAGPGPAALPEGAWPADTAATYLRQSQPRVATKTVLANP